MQILVTFTVLLVRANSSKYVQNTTAGSHVSHECSMSVICQELKANKFKAQRLL